jgi:hypothetical protein
LDKTISGGQTGVDRAALDAAMALGMKTGGWCPKGRRAEDGVIPARYLLQETPTGHYPQRTEWNVRDSDGTLVVARGTPKGGTRLTVELAQRLGRPYLVVLLGGGAAVGEVLEWLRFNQIGILNVAGPRESTASGIYQEARQFMVKLLTEVAQQSDG